MKKNIGQLDRLMRVFLGLALIVFAAVMNQPWAYLGIVPLVTGLAGHCPAYRLIGLSTVCKSCEPK